MYIDYGLHSHILRLTIWLIDRFWLPDFIAETERASNIHQEGIARKDGELSPLLKIWNTDLKFGIYIYILKQIHKMDIDFFSISKEGNKGKLFNGYVLLF